MSGPKPTSACLCGMPIPSFSFRIDPKHEAIAKAFFAKADLVVECPRCRRLWERPLADCTIVDSLEEALAKGGGS